LLPVLATDSGARCRRDGRRCYLNYARLTRRLARLERQTHAGGCPVCGARPNTPIVFSIEPGGRGTDDGQPDVRCEGCGRIMRFTLSLDRPGVEENGG